MKESIGPCYALHCCVGRCGPCWHLIRRANEIEECMRRIMSHKGVVGVIVINQDAIPIKSTMENGPSVQYAGLVTHLVDESRLAVKDFDGSNELTFIRLRTKKHEIVVCPERDYTMIVIQADPPL